MRVGLLGGLGACAVLFTRVKLCRFELRTEPGLIRSGMVHGGKVYETDGGTAIGVHDVELIRPLSPVPTAPSLRIFQNDFQPLRGPVSEEPHFYYGNPATLAGPNQSVLFPNFTTRVSVRAYVAAVIVTSGFRVEPDEADDMILGITLMTHLTAPLIEDSEKQTGGGFGRSIDFGGVLGPVIATPDELDDFLADQEFGRRYKLEAIGRVNGVERVRGNLSDLPWTFSEAVWHASQSCTVKEGDIFALGPVVDTQELILAPGDEFQLAVEQIGAVTVRLAEDI